MNKYRNHYSKILMCIIGFLIVGSVAALPIANIEAVYHSTNFLLTSETTKKKSYKLGDKIDGHTVVFVNDGGKSGLLGVVLGEETYWASGRGCGADALILGSNDDDEFSGELNTSTIIVAAKAETFCGKKSAAHMVRKKGSSWYLPAIRELENIESRLPAGAYWSSSESASGLAWDVLISNQGTRTANTRPFAKNRNHKVVAVKRF